MEPVGQLSPDGNYYWDKVKWVSTVSPDGKWRWDGHSWVALTPAQDRAAVSRSRGFFGQIPGFRSRSPWKMAIAVIGYLLIALFIAVGLTPESRGGIALGLGAVAIVLLAA